MNDWLGYVFSLTIGFGLGLLYYGGLWWTVGRLRSSSQPAIFYLLSLACRIVILLTTLFLLMQSSVVHLLVACAGLMIVRWFIVWHCGWKPATVFKAPAELQLKQVQENG